MATWSRNPADDPDNDEVSDETHVWSQTYQRDLGDILKLQSEVSQAVAREIRIKLTPQEAKRLAAVQGVSPAAYEAYLQGRHLWNKRTEESMRNSIACYENAIHFVAGAIEEASQACPELM